MNRKNITVFVFSCMFASGCEQEASQNERLREDFYELSVLQPLEEIQDNLREKREEELDEYYSFRADPKSFGWEPFVLSQNDQAVLSCLPELKSKFLTDLSDIRFDTDLIEVASLRNGLKLGSIVASGTTEYGHKTTTHSVIRLDDCKRVRGAYAHEKIFIGPKSGGVAHSPISPPEGDKRLLFRRYTSQAPFEVFVNSEKNAIATLNKPRLSRASLVEAADDDGCLFSVLDKGETAAGATLLSELCPSSQQRLQPISITYQLDYLWFGHDEILEHLARSHDEMQGTELLAPAGATDAASAEYLYQLYLGVRETPESSELDLTTTGYVWHPFAWHKTAWEKTQ